MPTFTKTKNNSLVINLADFTEIRKRVKHSAELASLNPENVFNSSQQEYINYCADFIIQFIDDHRKAKVSLPLENEYFSTYCNHVISDDAYPNLLKLLTKTKRDLAKA